MSKTLKIAKTIKGQSLRRAIPYLGIFAFAGASVNAVANRLNDLAEHPTAWYNVAAWFIELFTAFIIGLATEQLKIALASLGGGITKEKKRWGWVFFSAYAITASPTIAVSIASNRAEFGDNFWLGLLFPLLCIGSAIAAVLPDVVRAKMSNAKETTEETPPQPRPKKKQEFFAECEICGWFGQNGNGLKKAYDTARKATCARNAHKCKVEK